MPPPIAEIVDWPHLRDTILYGFIGGVGITAAFGFLLLGTVRARDSYQHRQVPHAGLYGFVGLAGVTTTAAGIILGLIAVSDT
jgi:hypothetical protein